MIVRYISLYLRCIPPTSRFPGPPDPPPVWTHPCKCTLVAHETCLLHWIKTQQHEFGRTRGDLKCPQCGDYYEFEGFNPPALRILNSINRTLSRCGRVITVCCAGTIIVSLGAGESHHYTSRKAAERMGRPQAYTLPARPTAPLPYARS